MNVFHVCDYCYYCSYFCYLVVHELGERSELVYEAHCCIAFVCWVRAVVDMYIEVVSRNFVFCFVLVEHGNVRYYDCVVVGTIVGVVFLPLTSNS